MKSTKKQVFSIIRRPLITEKAATTRSGNKFGAVFEVHPKANKVEIRKAIEKIFEVKVDKVRTINGVKKPRRVKNVAPPDITWKKAYVTLAEGHTLDVIEGL